MESGCCFISSFFFLFTFSRPAEQEDEVGDSSDEEDDPSKPSLWVERYAPRRYTDLLSDEVKLI